MSRAIPAASITAAGLMFAVGVSWLAIDPRPIDGFNAPKILLAGAGLSAAALAAFWARLRRRPARLLPPPGRQRAAVLLWLAGSLGSILTALLSARPGQSLDALRVAAVFLLAVPLGASEAYSRHRGKILALFLIGAAVNAVLVLLAAFKIFSPIAVLGEFETAALGALVGNPGHLGIALALAAVAALEAFTRPGVLVRLAGSGMILLAVAGILSTQTLTGLIAAGAGIAVFAVARYRRRAWPFIAAAVLLASSSLLVRPVRWRLGLVAEAARQGDWNKALTARGAPWLAGIEMAREHPLRGVGPGNFGSEFVPARLAAEARIRRHLVLPGMRTNSFSQAHNDYLDLAASIGIPLAACVLGSYFLVLSGLLRRAAGEPEAAVSAALLAAGAVAALSWFPFQIITSSLWLLLAAGRGYRLIGEGP